MFIYYPVSILWVYAKKQAKVIMYWEFLFLETSIFLT